MKRQSQVHLLLTEEEKKAAAYEAERHGMTLSAWVRSILRPKLSLLVGGAQP